MSIMRMISSSNRSISAVGTAFLTIKITFGLSLSAIVLLLNSERVLFSLSIFFS